MKKKPLKNMFSWMNPNLEVRETGKFGKGVFAMKDIKKDEILIVMGGYILTIEDDNELRGVVSDKPIEISDYFFIGPRKPSDLDLMPQHYVNHSCDPNVGFRGQIFMVAMKKIKKGEEISYDYAMVMNPDDRSNSYFKMECKCGSKNCRNMITEDDWEIADVQKRYDGFFQYFLQERINKKLKNKIKKCSEYRLKPVPWSKK